MQACRQAASHCSVTAARFCSSERRVVPSPQAVRRPTRCHSCQSDVLLVDAQNVLSRAHADCRRGCRLAGETAGSSFATWLHFLVAVAQPQLLVAVFDSPAAKQGPQQQQRQVLAPEYLRRRQRRKQVQAVQGGGGSSSAAVGTAPDRSPAARQAAGDPLRPYKRKVAELGGLSLEAAGGWEADDGLAAASAAVRERHPAARVLLASGDGDMQQLLDPQVRSMRVCISGGEGLRRRPCLLLVNAGVWRASCFCGYLTRPLTRPCPSWCTGSQVAWLQLHSQTILSCPLGVGLVTAGAFQRQHGFPPAAYPDWLALVGERRCAPQSSASVLAWCSRHSSLRHAVAPRPRLAALLLLLLLVH